MSYRFFLSYARIDDRTEQEVTAFFRDLEAKVASRIADPGGEPVAFMDQADLQPGEPWPEDLARALGRCRTFVPVMTARYFGREFCGKEWQVFENRCRECANRLNLGEPLPLIVPVLWVPPAEDPLPDFARRLHFDIDTRDVPAEDLERIQHYEQHGLLWIFKRRSSTHGNAYQSILDKLAMQIIKVGNEYTLEDIRGELLPLDSVPNRFMGSTETDLTASRGKTASFVAFAGTRTEMRALAAEREKVDYIYGDPHRALWKPFAPQRNEMVAVVADKGAAYRELIPRWISLDENLIENIRVAERAGSPVVLLIDPWVTRLGHYRALLERFDHYSFLNSVVMVIWNRQDQSTLSAWDSLQAQLYAVIARHVEATTTIFYRGEITSVEQLEMEIRDVLTYLEERLARKAMPVRRLGDSSFTTTPRITNR